MMKPVYNELSTYLTALTCIVIFFTYPDFRLYLSGMKNNFSTSEDIVTFYALGLIALVGFILSIIHVFVKRDKSLFEKFCMGVFAIGANALASIEAGIETINSGGSILVIFPIWNIVIGIIMIIQIRYGIFEVTDENASLQEVSGASVILLLIFALVSITFRLSWAMTFSICMFYSSSIFFGVTWVINRFNLQRAA
jgi:hypothetical protein